MHFVSVLSQKTDVEELSVICQRPDAYLEQYDFTVPWLTVPSIYLSTPACSLLLAQ